MAEEVNVSKRLESFEKAMTKMIGTNDKAYHRYPDSSNPVLGNFFDLDEIKNTLAYGEPASLRELSRFAYRYFGIYERVINYYSRLLLFDYVVTPKVKGNISKNKILNDRHLLFKLLSSISSMISQKKTHMKS